MSTSNASGAKSPQTAGILVAPYLDVLLRRLDAGDPVMSIAFGRHAHWGYWPEPADADGSPQDYADAAERLCRKVCDAAGVRDGMRVLDVGCGIGGTLASLNERFANLDMVGVNIDARQLRQAEKVVRPINGNRVRFVEADACRLPADLGTFDVVLAVECIFHFPSRPAFLAGAARCLEAGGKLALSDFVPPREYVQELSKRNLGKDEATLKSYGQVDLLCPVEEYRELADAAGLMLVRNEDISTQTLPTYAFMRADQRTWVDRKSARWHERATARLETATRMGFLRYSILGFARQAGAARLAA